MGSGSLRAILRSGPKFAPMVAPRVLCQEMLPKGFPGWPCSQLESSKSQLNILDVETPVKSKARQKGTSQDSAKPSR